MPAAYREAFDDEAIEAHAGIIERRGSSPTWVELWKELPERVVALCIVADDRPGLLSQISAALVAHEIDVVTAHAYCRTCPDGRQEAVDFLWVRRVPRNNGSIAPVRARDVIEIGELVDALVRGEAKVDPATRIARVSRATRTQKIDASTTRVRFENGAGDGTMILTVEATDRPGLLLLVTQAIFRANLQIIGLRATSEEGRAIDRFHLAELDAKPLVQARLLALQVEILGALEESREGEEELSPAP
jgi:UTP:GlnB (protein PII) uridylyltransferase